MDAVRFTHLPSRGACYVPAAGAYVRADALNKKDQ
jgi:hypothetical protein